MIAIFNFLMFFLCLKVCEKIANRIRKRAYKLNSKTTVLITGACSGIGKQLAINFAKILKCHIIIYDILPELKNTFRGEIENFGAKVSYYKCDVSKREDVEKTVAKTISDVKKIDILVNNAGIVNGKSVLDLSLQEIEKVMAVNYLGPVSLIKQILPEMISHNNGHIVNISSIAHSIYGTELSDYSASKGALYNFNSSLRLELKKIQSNISTTVVCPYIINTGMFKGFASSLDWIFPQLDEVSVGRTIFNSILEKREIVYIPWYYGNLWNFLNFILPQNILDKFLLVSSGTAMNNFVGKSKSE